MPKRMGVLCFGLLFFVSLWGFWFFGVVFFFFFFLSNYSGS